MTRVLHLRFPNNVSLKVFVRKTSTHDATTIRSKTNGQYHDQNIHLGPLEMGHHHNRLIDKQSQQQRVDESEYNAWLHRTFPSIVHQWSMCLWPMKFYLRVVVRRGLSPAHVLQQLLCCTRTHSMNNLYMARVEPSHRNTISKWISNLS